MIILYLTYYNDFGDNYHSMCNLRKNLVSRPHIFFMMANFYRNELF